MEKEHNTEDRYPCEYDGWNGDDNNCYGCPHADGCYPGEDCPFED